MRPRGVLVLSALILIATIMFGIGSVVEKSSAGTAPTAAHQETAGETGGETTAQVHAETANTHEAILGVNPESTPLIAAAIIGSIGVLVALWLHWRRAVVLWAAGTVMAIFAVLDMLEISHQVVEGHATLVALAGAVAVLHVAAALTAIRVATAALPMERGTAI